MSINQGFRLLNKKKLRQYNANATKLWFLFKDKPYNDYYNVVIFCYMGCES